MKYLSILIFILIISVSFSYAAEDSIEITRKVFQSNDTLAYLEFRIPNSTYGDIYLIVTRFETDLTLNGGGALTGVQKTTILGILSTKYQAKLVELGLEVPARISREEAEKVKKDKIFINASESDLN